MTQPNDSLKAKESESTPQPAVNLLSLVTRILDQLSLSAWLPGALLSVSLALLIEFRIQANFDTSRAVYELTENILRTLILTAPALILTTLITQAFSYSAIRQLEGYWYNKIAFLTLGKLKIRRHLKNKLNIQRRKTQATTNAFMSARDQILKKNISYLVVWRWEKVARGNSLSRAEAKGDGLSEADKIQWKIGWRRFADPWRLAVVDNLIYQEKRYPVKHRVLPTVLGNTLRATEDELKVGIEGLEGFVAVRRKTMSINTRIQHDQFRTRLDMYAIMVFISGFLAVATPLILWPPLFSSATERLTIFFISLSFILLTIASYRSAINSAEGYCAILRQINST